MKEKPITFALTLLAMVVLILNDHPFWAFALLLIL
jgi:hypothetical protein